MPPQNPPGFSAPVGVLENGPFSCGAVAQVPGERGDLGPFGWTRSPLRSILLQAPR
jgi:hypothetical protein